MMFRGIKRSDDSYFSLIENLGIKSGAIFITWIMTIPLMSIGILLWGNRRLSGC